MDEKLLYHLNRAIEELSGDEYINQLLEAKKQYFAITGQVNEEDKDYESRMSSFNNWYLFEYPSKKFGLPLIEHYLKSNKVEQNYCHSFLNVDHTLFEYLGTNFKKKHVFKDLIAAKKVFLADDAKVPAVIKNDLFIGRVISHGANNYILSGICVLPSEIRSNLMKAVKKLKKETTNQAVQEFLLKLEFLKTKWLRYGHIDPKKIFVLDRLE